MKRRLPRVLHDVVYLLSLHFIDTTAKHQSHSMDHSSRRWHQLEWNLGINFGTNWNRCAWRWGFRATLTMEESAFNQLWKINFFVDTGKVSGFQVCRNFIWNYSPEILPCKFPEIISPQKPLRERSTTKISQCKVSDLWRRSHTSQLGLPERRVEPIESELVN